MSHSKSILWPLSRTRPDLTTPGKRNTSRPVFTAHERSLAKSAWSASSARLSRDSFLPFGSCSLCLESAVDPVACLLGDIFCRECALTNILAQKKEIKRLEKTREHEEREAADGRARQDEEAQARAVKEFELVQAGFDVGRGAGRPGRDSSAEPADAKKGEKRKFALDEDEVAQHAENDRAKARKAIDDEKVRSDVRSHRGSLTADYLSESEALLAIFLGSVCDTDFQHQRPVARGQEEGEDIPHLSVFAGERPAPLLTADPCDDQLHRGGKQRLQDEDPDMSQLQEGVDERLEGHAGQAVRTRALQSMRNAVPQTVRAYGSSRRPRGRRRPQHGALLHLRRGYHGEAGQEEQREKGQGKDTSRSCRVEK